MSVLVRGVNRLVLDEAERSIHDALCVIRCLVKEKALIAGGGAPEIELAIRLSEHANTLSGMEQYCFRAFAEALEVIPYTLAENAGLNPIATVTELRNKHAQGDITAGINVRKGIISNILEENVVQPRLVSTSAIQLASETVRSILKIDDIVSPLLIQLYSTPDHQTDHSISILDQHSINDLGLHRHWQRTADNHRNVTIPNYCYIYKDPFQYKYFLLYYY